MVPKKRQSKRQTLKQKYKVQRKVKEHHRQLRSGPGLKKDPGIPNLWPFKEELLQDIQARRERAEKEKTEQRERRALEMSKARSRPSAELANLRADALRRQNHFSNPQAVEGLPDAALGVETEGTRKAYGRDLQKVIDSSDVILEVVDARDPQGCRSRELEQSVIGAGQDKRLVIVLNKADLVPRTVVLQWLQALRVEFPAVVFKSVSQVGRLGRKDGPHRVAAAQVLLQLLKNYCRSKDIKTSITVGVVGLPNVGKSSIINSLKASRAVEVGAAAGVTKSLQQVNLDRHIKLIDCPGVVMAKILDKEGAMDAVLRNSVRVQDLDDSVAPVSVLIGRCDHEQLMSRYEIPLFHDVSEFLAAVAQRRGKLLKGGLPDVDAAARLVLLDWNEGRIKWFTRPPALGTVAREERGPISTSLVDMWSREFSIDTIAQPDVTVDDGDGAGGDGAEAWSEFVEVAEEERMDEEVPLRSEFVIDGRSGRAAAPGKSTQKQTQVVRKACLEDDVNPPTRKEVNLRRKGVRRARRRSEKKAVEVADGTSSAAVYDLNSDFISATELQRGVVDANSDDDLRDLDEVQ